MSRELRKKLIEQIEKKRQSKVITYITCDRENLSSAISHDVVSIIHQHILALKKKDQAKIDFLIYSRGGASDVPWALVSMFREYCHKGSFSVLIPYRAHSAATVIALGADEIVMTKKAELGPIDATLSSGPYNPVDSGNNRLPVSVEDVTGYFALLDRIGCQRPEERMQGFDRLTEKVHPLVLGAVSRLLEETKLVGLRLLSTRAQPFTEEENHEIIRKLSSEVYSHSHAISRTEAVRYLGLRQVKNAESVGVESELWKIFSEYNKLFQLDSPFLPEQEILQSNLEEKMWPDVPIACVESLARLDCCKVSLLVKRLRNPPPTLNLNLNGLTFPQINFTQIPQGIDQQKLNEMINEAVKATIQPTLEMAAKKAVQDLLAALPEKGFQKVAMRSGWVKE